MATYIDTLLAQRVELKKRDPEAILIFALGEWYEAFDEDARSIRDLLGADVTKGVAYGAARRKVSIAPSQLETLLGQIVAAGKRAAVCERAGGNRKGEDR